MIDLSGKKILLVRNDNIGDLICTTPAIEALRKHYPDARIDIVVNSYNESVVRNNPFLDRVYLYTKPKHVKGIRNKARAFFAKGGMLWQIRREGYDAAVIFRAGYSGPAANIATITGAPVKVGVKNPKGSDPFTIYVNLGEGMHEVEFCFACLAPFGVSYGGERTRFALDSEQQNAYSHVRNTLFFHISSRIPENRYSESQFVQIINAFEGYPCAVTAEPADQEMAVSIAKQTHAGFVQTHSFEDLAAHIVHAKAFVGLDGGALHLAPALGVPTLIISGKTDMTRWYPWGWREYVLQHESRRADAISPETVIEKLRELLEKRES